jgi:malonyl-CoA/methylmalonyl-CoA synthetase
MNLPTLFAPSLQNAAQQVGLEFVGREILFGEIDARSNQLANRLLSEGLEPGDRVAVYLKNCVELIEVFIACVKAGFIFTPMNILYREGEIAHIVADAGPGVLFAHLESDEILAGVIARNPQLKIWHVEELPMLLEGQPAVAPPSVVSDDTVAALVYTSGTTGRPKGAMLSHGNFAANAENLAKGWRMNASDRLLLPLPLFHVHGLGNGVHTWLALGYRTRLLERFDKETIIQQFLDFKPTVFFGVPTMYVRLLETPRDIAAEIGRSMRLFVSGSAPLPAAIHEQFRDLFGHVILERYGMSETLMLISNPFDGERRPGSVGHPLPGVSVRISDPFSEKSFPDGEAGEVLVKGGNVFSGYWRNPGATKDSFTSDGYFRTGDVGVRSADGYYTLQGRLRELIISGGFNIYPREVEEFIMNLPGVAAASVIGVADAVKGEVPVAFVVPDATAAPQLEVIEAACRKGLASFKVPRKFLLIDELPRNAMGKVQKNLLALRLRDQVRQ